MAELTGKTVVVTGASKGIGAATAAAMVSAGARVVAHYGSDRAGAEAAIAAAAPGQAFTVGADFGHPPGVDGFWEEAVAALGRVDVVVNNAAIMRQEGGIEDDIALWDDAWDETLRVNVLSATRVLRHAVRHWVADGRGGSLIGISSWAAIRGTLNRGAIAYGASKAALAAATKSVARTYAGQGILAYVIAPGVVRTRMSEESAARTGGEDAITAGLPLGEWIPPAEIGELAVFLASGRARHLTGATLDINGAAHIR